jgi:hypothetical protein
MGIRTSYSTNNRTKRFSSERSDLEVIEIIGRGERIRTSDPLVPNHNLLSDSGFYLPGVPVNCGIYTAEKGVFNSGSHDWSVFPVILLEFF